MVKCQNMMHDLWLVVSLLGTMQCLSPKRSPASGSCGSMQGIIYDWLMIYILKCFTLMELSNAQSVLEVNSPGLCFGKSWWLRETARWKNGDVTMLNRGKRPTSIDSNIECLLRLIVIALHGLSHISLAQSYKVGLLLSLFYRWEDWGLKPYSTLFFWRSNAM